MLNTVVCFGAVCVAVVVVVVVCVLFCVCFCLFLFCIQFFFPISKRILVSFFFFSKVLEFLTS